MDTRLWVPVMEIMFTHKCGPSGASRGMCAALGVRRVQDDERPWMCRYSASVQLASKVIDTEAKLQATLLHELCHVATWVLPPHVAKVISCLRTARTSIRMPHGGDMP